jgi:hypothetical protein
MKVHKPPQSGSLGDVVAKRNRFGQYETKKIFPKNRNTAAMRRARGNLAKFSQLWNNITDEQRVAWWRRALEVRSRPRLGQSGALTGQTLFVKINTVLATCGYEPGMDPPPLPCFSLNPVVSLRITQGDDGPILNLRLKERPAQDIMLFGSPPRNAGRMYCSEFEFLDLLPAPVDGQCDITRAYVWKHGAPPPGSRVFIRAWPQENGWEGKAMMMGFTAIVPPRKSALRNRQDRRTGAKAK